MKIYTSYYSKAKKLKEHGIEMVSISRGEPKWFSGRRISALAPTWEMLKMDDENYDREYEKILKSNNADDIVSFLSCNDMENHVDVALLCWEKDWNNCHRKTVAEWLIENGYEVEEFNENTLDQLTLL